jgi:hypothetical protein
MSEQEMGATVEAGTPEPGAEAAMPGTPETGAEVDSGQPAPDPGDYLARVRSDPEFAVEQIRAKDRALTKANQESKKWERLEKYGQPAEVFEDFATKYSQLTQNPQMQGVIDSFFQTGQVQVSVPQADTQGQTEDDEYMDPDVKALRDELREVRRENQALVDRMSTAETRGNVQTVTQGFDEVMKDWPDDLHGEVATTLEEQVRRIETQAMSGAPAEREQAKATLANLAGPQGKTTLKYLLSDLREQRMGQIVDWQRSREATTVAQHATTEPQRISTAGGEPAFPAGFEKLPAGERVRLRLVANAKKRGHNPDSLFRAQ